MDAHRWGRWCEALAEAALVEQGWRILDRNVRFRRREIDLIVRRGGTVAFVEVKGRRGPGCGHPLEAITALKRREIESVATWWMARHGEPGVEYRFDAVSVVLDSAGRPLVEHLEAAWWEGGR